MKYVQLLSSVLAILLSHVAAQEIDSTTTTDVPGIRILTRTGRLCPFIQDVPKTFQLYLPWDTWGHSDLFATATNPFISADIRLGALRLDGSLGIPIHSAVIPSATINSTRLFTSPDVAIVNGRRKSFSATDQEYHIAPLQDISRADQTYFFWDQGSYQMQDIQIGGSAQLDESRNLMLAGQARNHPGPYAKAGPSSDNYQGNVLQNYLFDYQQNAAPSFHFNFSLLHQKEQAGLPLLLEQGLLTSDRRHSRTLAYGLQLNWTPGPVNIQLYTATMTNYLTITTDMTNDSYIDRRSLSQWMGGILTYDLSSAWHLVGGMDVKQRSISDKSLGYRMSRWLKNRAGVTWTGNRLSAYSGLALIESDLKLEGWVVYRKQNICLKFSKESGVFFDYPHHNRRQFQDSVSWLENPLALDKLILTGHIISSSGIITAQLAQITTGDHRTAATAGLMTDWELWKDILRFSGTVTAVNTQDTCVFPTHLFTQGSVTFTLPLRRMRARPFAAATVSYISNDFAIWLDPRYADSAPYVNPGGTTSSVLWVSAEVGLKAKNFELRMRIYNPFGATIQNSPFYLPQPGWGDLYMRHYSLSWRFPPQTPTQSTPPTTQ
ncbi:hypothetical protein ACFL45_03760 [Candidatus Neomarinimicrobiota bacterium]